MKSRKHTSRKIIIPLSSEEGVPVGALLDENSDELLDENSNTLLDETG
tara:strand:- start:869 stop:1012 length:144 start_codon:yes stop_codon:yes gene_type:complete